MKGDVVDQIAAEHQGCDRRVLKAKFNKMAKTRFVFFRATGSAFHRRCARELSGVVASPLGWITGDMHIENFGAYEGQYRDKHLICFDITDFDEAALAPALIDLLRFMTSILAARAALGIDRDAARSLMRYAQAEYAAALRPGKVFTIAAETAPSPISDLISRVSGRRRDDLLDKYSEPDGATRVLSENPDRLLPLRSSMTTRMIKRGLKTMGASDESLDWSVLDVKERVAGTASLGRTRLLLLLEGEGSPMGNMLLDCKSAHPSRIPSCYDLAQPTFVTEAERIVFVERMAMAVPPRHLAALTFGDASFVARELQPTQDRLNSDELAEGTDLRSAIGTMARVAAYAHLRGAGRSGAAPFEEWSAYAQVLEDAKLASLVEALDDGNTSDHAQFKSAWEGDDPRLIDLVD